ncbi:unnamed protein product, partial [Polarella glacialis]
ATAKRLGATATNGHQTPHGPPLFSARDRGQIWQQASVYSPREDMPDMVHHDVHIQEDEARAVTLGTSQSSCSSPRRSPRRRTGNGNDGSQASDDAVFERLFKDSEVRRQHQSLLHHRDVEAPVLEMEATPSPARPKALQLQSAASTPRATASPGASSASAYEHTATTYLPTSASASPLRSPGSSVRTSAVSQNGGTPKQPGAQRLYRDVLSLRDRRKVLAEEAMTMQQQLLQKE